MLKIAAIAGGGALGALVRYYSSLFVSQKFGSTFPFGTMFVNITGSLIIGFMWGVTEQIELSPNIRFAILTGFLGAFTTFSTYSLETLNLLRDNEIILAVANVGVSTISGLVCAYLGYSLSKAVF